MTFSEITEKINQEFGEDFLSEVNAEAKQPFIVIDKAKLLVLAKFLQQTEGLYFDHLACITTIDNRQKDNKFEVIYHLDSFVYLHSFTIYIYLPEECGAPPRTCGKLAYWLYGFRPAASAWEKHYSGLLEAEGFRRGTGCGVVLYHPE